MARRARSAVGGVAHLVVLQAQAGRTVLHDEVDQAAFMHALQESMSDVAVHGYGLAPDQVRLLLRPATAQALSRAMQALGRRFVAALHRRHGGTGSPWAGRFRAALIEPGEWTLWALRHVERAGAPDGGFSSAAHRLGALPSLAGRPTDPPELWSLGNTPFEREIAWRRLLEEPLPGPVLQRLEAGCRSGAAVGSPAFMAAMADQLGRPLTPGRRGRPRGTGRPAPLDPTPAGDAETRP